MIWPRWCNGPIMSRRNDSIHTVANTVLYEHKAKRRCHCKLGPAPLSLFADSTPECTTIVRLAIAMKDREVIREASVK